MVLEGILLLGAETVGEAIYPRGPLCPSGLICLNGTLFFQVVNFTVFVFIINFVLLKPIQKVMEERQNYILSNRSEAQQRLVEAKALAADYEAQLVGSRRKAQDLIAKAEAEAMQMRTQQLAEVQAEAQARLEGVRQEVNAAKAEALKGIQQEVVKLSAQITSKLLTTSK